MPPVDVRSVVERYFGRIPDECKFEGETVSLFAFVFRAEGNSLVLTSHPTTFSVPSEYKGDPERAAWEAVAAIKVRCLRKAEEVIRLARTGDLYDEDYYNRRGGGSPYVGYPYTESGACESNRFKALAGELAADLGPVRLLDCGCATGILVNELQMVGFEARGIDISQWSVDHAVCRGIQRGDLRSLPFPAESFDCIISQDVMEHFHPDDMAGVLSEQNRVLAPDGVVFHFIPFYEQHDIPFQLDAHLCNASKHWWDTVLSEHFRIVNHPSLNQWNYDRGILATYYKLMKL